MKTILLIGGTGFLGSFIVNNLHNEYKILVVIRKESKLGNINKNINNITLINIGENSYESIFKNNDIDIIINSAVSYGRNGENISDMIETNLTLPIKLLELGSKYGLKNFINFGTFFNSNINFGNLLDIYVLNKENLKFYLDYILNRNKNIIFFNLKIQHMYGPRDNNGKFIPNIIKDLLSNKESIELTYGEQKRDLIYVEDVVSIINLLLNNTFNYENNFIEFDIGTGKSISIKEIVERLKEITKSKSKLNFGAIDYRGNEIMDSKADISFLKKLGFNSFKNIKDGLNETVNFYLKNIK